MSNANDPKEFPINRWGAPVGDGFIHLHDCDFDFDNYFYRHAAGELSEEEEGDFSARVYGMFCRDFFKSHGDPAAIQPWVASYIAKKLHAALAGAPWNDIMGLPWDEPTPRFTPKGQRAFDTYAHVHNTRLGQPNANVTDLIAEAAQKFSVSFETARNDYYTMKHAFAVRPAKIPAKFLISNGDF